jgi:hypothetical protein
VKRVPAPSEPHGILLPFTDDMPFAGWRAPYPAHGPQRAATRPARDAVISVARAIDPSLAKQVAEQVMAQVAPGVHAGHEVGVQAEGGPCV